MPLLTLDKILKIVQICLTIIQMAINGFLGIHDDPEPEKDVD